MRQANPSIQDVAERYRTRRLAEASGGGLKPLPLKRPTPVRTVPATRDDIRPRAASREACPYCSARGDLGCDHFAPCLQEDLPREGRGLLYEKTGKERDFSHFDEEGDRRLLALRAQGLSEFRIAQAMERSSSAIHNRRRILERRARETA